MSSVFSWPFGLLFGPLGELIHALFEACAQDAACAEAYPGLEGRLDGVIEGLNRKPVAVPNASNVNAKPAR